MRFVKSVLLSLLVGTASSIANAASTRDSKNPPLPSLQEALVARKDLWGEAAMAQSNGPSYEFFEQLLPPPRYVNADFRYYPIVLSAPNATVKARLVSNGSGVNLRGGSGQWNDNGTPVLFRVGLGLPVKLGPDQQFRFGLDGFHPSDNTESVSFGGEWSYHQLFALRAGYQNLFMQDSELGLTAGAGFQVRAGDTRLRADYAWAAHQHLDGTHRITIGVSN